MQEIKFIEDESVKDNCKMLLTYTFPGEGYVANNGYKDNAARLFMELLKTDMYANEIEVMRPEFDTENDRIIILNITLNNGKVSKSLIREAISTNAIAQP